MPEIFRNACCFCFLILAWGGTEHSFSNPRSMTSSLSVFLEALLIRNYSNDPRPSRCSRVAIILVHETCTISFVLRFSMRAEWVSG
jgi:hypothetical protein